MFCHDRRNTMREAADNSAVDKANAMSSIDNAMSTDCRAV